MKKVRLIYLFAIFCAVTTSGCSSNEINKTSSNLITIPAHSRTAQENRINEIECEKAGGYDVTDQQDITISKGSYSPLLCNITNLKKAHEYDKTHGTHYSSSWTSKSN